MVSKEDLEYLESEKNPKKYGRERFGAALITNDQSKECSNYELNTPYKVLEIYGGPVVWFDSPEKDRASVGIIYVQTLDGKAAFKAPWEARGGLTDWYHFREILRGGVDAVGAAKNMRRGNNDERPLLLSFYDPDLIEYRLNELGKERHPIGVIVTGSGQIDGGLDHLVFNNEGKSVIFTSEVGIENLENLAKNNLNVSIEIIGPSPRELDMKQMLRILKSKYGVERFLALGGPGFSTDLYNQDCIDNYFINIAPTLSSDPNIRSFIYEAKLPDLSDLRLVSLKKKPINSPDEEGKDTIYTHYIPKRD